MKAVAGYVLTFPGLGERVAQLAPSAKHERLLAALSRSDPRLAGAVVAMTHHQLWGAKRRVYSASGDLVHDDHRAFLAAELEKSGGAAAAMQRLQPLDYRLTQCDITPLFVIADAGGPQANFVQAEIQVEDEFVDRRLFDKHESWRSPPRNLEELCDAAEAGPSLADEARTRVRPSAYRLDKIIDFTAFVAEGADVDRARRERAAGKVMRVADVHPDRPTIERNVTIAELDPGLMRYAWSGQRLVDDWTASSAGRSGARLCRHWVFKTSDYTDSRSGERWVGVVPAWTHTRKIAKLKPSRQSDYELYGRLQAIDRRVGVPFAWYFYMLHGNLVEPWAGERVLGAAEGGLIVLPEHDYQVLKRWSVRSYGF